MHYAIRILVQPNQKSKCGSKCFVNALRLVNKEGVGSLCKIMSKMSKWFVKKYVKNDSCKIVSKVKNGKWNGIIVEMIHEQQIIHGNDSWTKICGNDSWTI